MFGVPEFAVQGGFSGTNVLSQAADSQGNAASPTQHIVLFTETQYFVRDYNTEFSSDRALFFQSIPV